MKNQLRDAYSMIDELKTNFRGSFIDLQQKLQDCVEEKEKMQFKKYKSHHSSQFLFFNRTFVLQRKEDSRAVGRSESNKMRL